jgi:hypothetical protein
MGFGKRESPPVPALEVTPSKPARRPAPFPRALEVPSIGTAKKIKAMFVYGTILFGLLGIAGAMLIVEHPFSYAAVPIKAIDGLFE